MIDPETGEECPVGVQGEMCNRGYNTMKGYYKNPEATAEVLDENNFLHSGDLGIKDEDGNYRITGRIYQIENTEILDAVSCHTTGRPHMTLLDKIIYIADYIEPGRCEAPDLQEIRRLAFTDIDECLYTILHASLEYLKSKSEVIDPLTEQTYLYYNERRI